MADLRAKFEEIYNNHNVDIVGFWANAEDETEVFYMTRYENEDDYKRTVEELRSDDLYMNLGRDLQEIRTENQSTRLIPWTPN